MAIILEGAQALRPMGTYTVAFGATDALATTTLGAQIIRLHANAACCVDLDGLAASTATCFRMAQDQTEYFKVQLQGQRVHVIGDGATGTLYVTECG